MLLRRIHLVTYKQFVLLPLRFACVGAWFGKTVKTAVTDRQAIYAKMTEGRFPALAMPLWWLVT